MSLMDLLRDWQRLGRRTSAPPESMKVELRALIDELSPHKGGLLTAVGQREPEAICRLPVVMQRLRELQTAFASYPEEEALKTFLTDLESLTRDLASEERHSLAPSLVSSRLSCQGVRFLLDPPTSL